MIVEALTQIRWITFTRWTPAETFCLWCATLLFLRHFAVILAAEQGRKKDLHRVGNRLGHTQMQLSVVLPCETTADLAPLQTTLAHLLAQAYPGNLLKIFVVCPQPVSDALAPILHQADPGRQMKALTYPLSNTASFSELARWAIERVMAHVGHGGLMVLTPGDAVKSDFASVVAARLLEQPVIQGNILDRSAPRTLLSVTQSLANRVRNRVVNAGRWHLGLNPWLLETGWAVRQELLEMVPYQATNHLRNLEYTMRLALQGVRVSWAPSMQVFREPPGLSMRHMGLQILSVLDQTRLVLVYLPLLTLRSLIKVDIRLLDMGLHLLKPPAVLLGLALVVAGFMAYTGQLGFGSTKLYAALALMVFTSQWVALLVARGKWADVVGMVFLTVPAYVWSLLFLPFSLGGVFSRLAQKSQPALARYRQTARTRFQDEIIIPLNNQFASSTAYDPGTEVETAESSVYTAVDEAPTFTKAHATPYTDKVMAPVMTTAKDPYSAMPLQPNVDVVNCWLSNGQKKLACTITITADTGKGHRIQLAYRGQSSTTQWHNSVEAAYTELAGTLDQHGLTLLQPQQDASGV
jgi:hypothetical protein